MKYPYIGKGKESGTVVMMVKPECGLIIESKTWATKDGKFETSIDETYITNITHEYLQNTYGEVQSPEHAEFIVELGKNESAIISTAWTKGKCFNFYTNSSGELHLDFYDKELASDSEERLITIPPPPKADKKELSEWPQVGDVVCWDGNDYTGTVKAISDGNAWCKLDNGLYYTIQMKRIKKPKTPEEELHDEIKSIIFKKHIEMATSIHVKNSLAVMAGNAVEIILNKYNITPKASK